jgi:nitric oxide reductase NorQ protein
VACHDELSAGDLVGRFLIRGEETVWQDGPLTRAVREGGICYLDEVVEARKDTTVILHPLIDDRRELPVEKTGERVEAPPEFMLVASYNPGYQQVFKNLKPSTRQRFVSLAFDFPPAPLEAEIVARESGVDAARARRLVELARRLRDVAGHDLEESPSTRLLVHAAQLMADGLAPLEACRVAVVEALSDDPAVRQGLLETARAYFES